MTVLTTVINGDDSAIDKHHQRLNHSALDGCINSNLSLNWEGKTLTEHHTCTHRVYVCVFFSSNILAMLLSTKYELEHSLVFIQHHFVVMLCLATISGFLKYFPAVQCFDGLGWCFIMLHNKISA